METRFRIESHTESDLHKVSASDYNAAVSCMLDSAQSTIEFGEKHARVDSLQSLHSTL
jgi:hypothetical protein